MTADERNIETDIRDAAIDRGATVHHCGDGHFQIRGRLLVNYYPFSKRRSAYVAGTTHGMKDVSPTQAVAMAFSAPPVAPPSRKDTRSSKSRRIRKQIHRNKGNHCHWCQRLLSLDESTIEHIVPLNRGGLDNANNRALSCHACNQARGGDMPELQK